ncbi:Golgi integral membrane protein 4-like isoform X1 [Temnothorax curvispinosus]|uniref:Golgi integral membrane protein 4-like isoform X1 n=1 Tax=Temnothorax curvispinosus TaxID=300111 RepID=A0A6J1RK51_9HYME|nr:Golgi integral membrane protein 4-like isoform X1 [Temnothorax curvispinosus]
MTGSRLGRGRGGRLALYGGCAVVVVLTMIVYRNTISEMTRLQEMQVQCLHQQESLAAQLQVIFEYKVRLEKSLAEEKSSNAAVKQELQQRASREKSLRDKDSIEAMQRFNSLQQTYRLLQTEHRDLQEECKKREKQALDETNRLESTLQDLRARIRQAQEDKFKALEHLKTKYLETDDEKTRLQEKYNELMQNRDNTGSTVDHLRKEIFQLRRELESAKKFYARSTSPSSVLVTPRASVSQSALQKEDSQPIPAPQQQQQQVSAPQPPYVSHDRRAVGGATPSVEKTLNDDANEPANDIRFVQQNGNIVPAGPGEVKEIGEQREPSANDLQQKQQKDVVERPNVMDDEKNGLEEEQRKQSVASSRKAENTTVASNANLVSPSVVDKPAPLPARPLSKVKVPVGVLPIPEMIEQNDDADKEKREEEIRKREDAAAVHNLQPPPPKLAPANAADDKEEKEPIVEPGNLDPPFVANPPARHVGEQVERRAKDAWLRVGPGVQEVGEELNRVPGLDDGQANGGDDQYDGDYDKEQQKNDIHLAEGEDEGEDEGDDV